MTSTQIEPRSGRFHWGDEESSVERRSRWPWRVRRFIKRIFIPVLLLVGVTAVLRDAEFTRSIIPIAGQVLQILVFMLIFVSQFILLFWFLARTRSYTIMPDSGGDGISFDDYRGQPEILEQAHQIVTLLRGVRALSDFEYEFELSMMNKALYPAIETIFLPTDQKYFVLRSSGIKEVARFGGDISSMVPDVVAKALTRKCWPTEGA